MKKLSCALLVLGAVVLGTVLPGLADPAKDLKSKDYRTRIKAVDAIRTAGGEDAEKLLLLALKDKDWEVVEHAVKALADHGGKKALKQLLNLAAAGPVRRVRLAAAASLAALAPEYAAKRLYKRLKKDEAVHTAEALSVLARRGAPAEPLLLRKALRKATKFKEAAVRAAVAGAWRAFPEEERVERFERLLADSDDTVIAAALDSLLEMPEIAYLPAATGLLALPAQNDVLARRAIAAILAILAAVPPDEAAEALRLLEALVDKSSSAARSAARVARLLGLLGEAPPTPVDSDDPSSEGKEKGGKKSGRSKKTEGKPGADPGGQDEEEPAPAPQATLAPEVCVRLLQTALSLDFPGARAGAVRALRRIGTPEAIELASTFLLDAHPRVRIQALGAIVAGRGLADAKTLWQVSDRLATDESAIVREEAAVLMGRSGPEGAPFDAPVEALTKALGDESWAVAVVSAVSLGKTRAESAVAPLAEMLNRKKVKDWRLRGAAVVGLGKVQQGAAIPHLIAALKDRDLCVRRNAYEFLRRLTKLTMRYDHVEWTAWWKRHGPGFVFEDRKKIARQLKQGGYATKPIDVYDKGKAALDIVVLQSRGDHIEQLLDKLRVPYRITRAAQIDEAELHSFAVFISNCTGEIQKNDIERLQWFVRVGGYIFASCWALQHTVEQVYPGPVRKLVTKGQVIDHVVAEACPGESPFLKDVFRWWTQPIYVLSGAHLIEVLQPERVEVLIDSAEAAAHWGDGNMACWFSAGHGVILDSANHFDLQGLEQVTGLKTAEDRMGYSMDHCGLDYAELRYFKELRVWGRQAEALKKVRDLSAFRFITNFARLKRKSDP